MATIEYVVDGKPYTVDPENEQAFLEAMKGKKIEKVSGETDDETAEESGNQTALLGDATVEQASKASTQIEETDQSQDNQQENTESKSEDTSLVSFIHEGKPYTVEPQHVDAFLEEHEGAVTAEVYEETQKRLQNTDTFPLSYYQANNTELPDGRMLGETEEYENWAKSLGGYEVGSGKEGTYQERLDEWNFFNFRKNLKNYMTKTHRHAEGGYEWKVPITQAYAGIFGLDSAPPEMEFDLNHFDGDIPDQVEHLDQDNYHQAIMEANESEINEVPGFDYDAGHIEEFSGIPVRHNDLQAQRSGENTNKSNEVTDHFYKQFGLDPNKYKNYTNGFRNIEETIVPMLNEHYNKQFNVEGYDGNFIRFEEAKGVFSGGKDAVEIWIGNEKTSKVIDLNINGRAYAPLDPLALDAIELHINKYFDEDLRDDLLNWEYDLYNNNPELVNAAVNQKSNPAKAKYYNELDKINNIEGMDIDGDGNRLIRRQMADWMSGDDGVSVLGRDLSQGRFASLGSSQSAWSVDETGFFNFTDRNGKTYRVPYSYLHGTRFNFASANGVIVNNNAYKRHEQDNIDAGGEYKGGNNVNRIEQHSLYYDQHLAIEKAPSKLVAIRKKIALAKNENMFENEDGTLVELTGDEARGRLDELLVAEKKLMKKWNWDDAKMFDENGNWKYKSMWVENPDKPGWMMKVDWDGNQVEGEEREMDLSDDDDYINDLANATNKD